LRSPAAFQRLFQKGARIERPAFVLLWIREPGPRAVAFAAGRRLGGSVVRNRARRRLREAYRRQRPLLPADGLRVCILARPGALTTPFPDLLRQLDSALRQVGRHRG
jgi:ribonuclease P protein component